MANGFLTTQQVETKQSTDLEIITFRVVSASVPASPSATRDAAANQAALPEGWNHAIVSKSGSVYTFTLARPSARTICIVGAHALTAARIFGVSTVSNTAFTIATTDLSGVAADANFHVTIIRFGNPKVY